MNQLNSLFINSLHPHNHSVSRNVLWGRQKLKEQFNWIKGEGQPEGSERWTFSLSRWNTTIEKTWWCYSVIHSLPNSKGSTHNGKRWNMNTIWVLSLTLQRLPDLINVRSSVYWVCIDNRNSLCIPLNWSAYRPSN